MCLCEYVCAFVCVYARFVGVCGCVYVIRDGIHDLNYRHIILNTADRMECEKENPAVKKCVCVWRAKLLIVARCL